MAIPMVSFSFCFFLLWLTLSGFFISSAEGAKANHSIHRLLPFNRSSFPHTFIFGAGSAAYQIEGAARMDNRGPCIWDTLTSQHPEKIADRSNGDVADDFYHLYKEDIGLMKKVGLDSFRFSISWSRILPKGTISGGVNQLGVNFYNNLINELLANGIKPFVTLLHFDTPQALEDYYGGLLGPQIVRDFANYADFCFKTFGDRVKQWVTLNEPNLWSVFGYDYGTLAPSRCSSYVGNCTAGNSATEPYVAAHHLLLAHATAVKLYKDRYQAQQKGQIGITLVSQWFEPKFETSADNNASSRAFDFMLGWFADPVVFGDYPQIMKSRAGNRLPTFSQMQSKLLRGSFDFLGINYYTGAYVEQAPPPNALEPSYTADMNVLLSNEKNGAPIGTPTPTASGWFYIYPKGLYDLLVYVKSHYNNPPIIITENGVPQVNNNTLPIGEALKDAVRIRYIEGHLSSTLQAIKEGVNVKAYYIWSFLDDFEWDSGYTVRFGLTFVDYKNKLRRYLKYSAYWVKMFLLK